MALDEDGFLLTAFRKVKKIRKGLRSNGTSNIAGFLQRNRFMRLGEDWKNRACASVSLLTFYSSKPLLIGYLSRYSDILSGSLRSGILCEIDSELYMYVFSYQDSFVNMIDLNVHKIRKISITTFAHQHIQACYEPRTYRCLVFALLMWLFTCSTITLVNTVFICRLTRKNKSLSLTSWASWPFFL